MENLIIAVCLETQYQRLVGIMRKKSLTKERFMTGTYVAGLQFNEKTINTLEEANQVVGMLQQLLGRNSKLH